MATSETSARVGTGLEIIEFEHLGRDHHRLAGATRRTDHLLLQAGHLLERQLDAEIAARDHHRIGDVENVRKVLDRLRLLHLGHHRDAAAGDLFRLGDVVGPLDERQRDPVGAGVERGFEIGVILAGQRGDAEHGVRDAHPLARREPAADLDPGHRPLRGHFDRNEPDLAVVEQQSVAGAQRGQDLRMRQLDPRLIARRRIGIEDEGRAARELDRLLAKGTDA